MRARSPALATLAALAVLGVGGLAGAPASKAPTSVKVKKGDTLSAIAVRTRVPVADLVAANKLADPNLLRTGQVLVLKKDAAKAAPAAKPVPKNPPGFHLVRAGDTVESIAARAKVSPAFLRIANGLLPGEPLFAGARLRLTMPRNIVKAPKPDAGGEGVHTVVKGENLALIAKRFSTTVPVIAKRNAIRNPNRVVQGTRLVVPNAPSFRCPVPGGSFVNDYGLPRGEGTRFHQGTDLMAPRGTPVVAPVSGVVTQKSGGLGGRQIWLRSADGTAYLGSHLDRFGEAGKVAAGTVIGYVGDSGNARGGPPHLHFEIHPAGGEPVNPYPLLVAVCRS